MSETFADDWIQWHREREAELTSPHGFLAITGQHWLTAAPARYPDAAGEWTATSAGVSLTLAEDEQFAVDGVSVHGTYDFGVIPERASVFARSGDAAIEIARRGGRDILRPRHPGTPLLTTFTGVPAYPPDERWVATCRYRPFRTPRHYRVGSVVDGLRYVYEAPGAVEFEAGGRPHRLVVFNGDPPGRLQVLFTDATSGITTHQAGRSLPVAEPDADGLAALDFNRAVNLPCAFTEFATCSLPPRENQLLIAVEAGEQIPVL